MMKTLLLIAALACPVIAETDAELVARLDGLGFKRQVSGFWTPQITCADPTGLYVSTATAGNVLKGDYVRTGRQVTAWARCNFGMIYTSATGGRFRVAGLPFVACSETDTQKVGSLTFQCVNIVAPSGFPSIPAGYTQFGPIVFAGKSYVEFFAAGPGAPERGLYVGPNTQGEPFLSNAQPIVLMEFAISYLTDDGWPQ